MTINAVAATVIYSGSGSTGPFAIEKDGQPIPYEQASHIKVKRQAVGGTVTTLVLDSDYTVASNAITLTTALAVGEKLAIYRDEPLSQESDFSLVDAFSSTTHNDVADRLTRLVQQLNDRINRSISFDRFAASGANLELTNRLANSVIGFDGDGNLVVIDVDELTDYVDGESLGVTPVNKGGTGVTTLADVRKILGAGIALESATTTAPPSVVNGEHYLVPTGASGDWSAQAGKVAYAEDDEYSYLTPAAGWTVFAADTNYLWVYDGSAWNSIDSPATYDGTLGVDSGGTGASTAAVARKNLGVNFLVQSATTTTPPTVVNGEHYVIPTGATGAWAAQIGTIAYAADGAFTYLTPEAGWTAYADDSNSTYFHNGSSWNLSSSGGAESSGVVLLDTTDDAGVAGVAKPNVIHGGNEWRAHWTQDGRSIVIYGDQASLGYDGAGDNWGPFVVPWDKDNNGNIVNIYAGLNYLLILTDQATGNLWHMGQTDNGQGGRGATSGTTLLPTRITKFVTDAVKIASVSTEGHVGESHKFWFAVTTGGAVYGCGYSGATHTMGYNSTSNLSTPRKMTESDGATPLANIASVACSSALCPVWALTTDNKAWRWGAGSNGAHGDGNTTALAWPEQLETTPGSGTARDDIADVQSIAGTVSSTVRAVTWLLTTAGKIEAAGSQQQGIGDGTVAASDVTTFQSASGTIDTKTVDSIVIGGGGVPCCIAITDEGEAWLVGRAQDGILGDGSTANLGTFTKIDDLPAGWDGAVTGAKIAGSYTGGADVKTAYIEATISGTKRIASIGSGLNYETATGKANVSAASRVWEEIVGGFAAIQSWQTVGSHSEFGIEIRDINSRLWYAGANDQGQAGNQPGNLHSVPYLQPCVLSGTRVPKSTVHQGPYSDLVEYSWNDEVQRAGSTWRYHNDTPSTGNTPPDLPTESDDYWYLVARAGSEGATYAGTSTTSIEVPDTSSSVVEVTLTTQLALAYAAGALVRVSSTASGEGDTHWFQGVVTSYDVDTGEMVIDAARSLGAGDTRSAWSVNIAGESGDVTPAATAAASAASASASAAATSETNAGTSATAAASSATAAATSATNAASSATAASGSASAAATSETNAGNSASAAATSATNASNSASAAATSETNAANSASAASTSETNAGNSATAAASSATDAANQAAALTGTSTTSLAIGTGSKTFTTQAGKQWGEGTRLFAFSDADPANYMFGIVTSYSGTTLEVDVTNVGGSGTLADWTLRIGGDVGDDGSPGAAGAAGTHAGLRWQYDSASTSMAEPSTGYFRLNNGTLASVTAAAFDAATAESGNPSGIGQFTGLSSITNATTKGRLILISTTTAGSFAIFDITALTDNTSWAELTLSHINSNGSWSGDEAFVAFVIPAGNDGAGGGGGGGGPPDIILQQQESAGTDGDNLTSGAWRTRTLNTVVRDTSSGALVGGTISSNQFDLAAGSYLIMGFVIGYRLARFQARLYNVDDTATAIPGGTGVSNSTSGDQTHAWMIGALTIAATKTFELQSQSNSSNTNGGGQNGGYGETEVYNTLMIWVL